MKSFKERKEKFINDNLELAQAAKFLYILSPNTAHKMPTPKDLINLARKKLGYSHNTSNCDILYGLCQIIPSPLKSNNKN